MAGYIRQDTTNNIADGNIINAADFDAEYDAIEDAFDAATGHVHDGTEGNGAPITKVGPTQEITVTTTAIVPKTDDLLDLGSSSLEFKDLYIDGTANIDSLVADTADINGGTIDGATIATSDITVGAAKTLDVSAGTLTLADNQISGDKVEGGTINAITINTLTSGTVDINGGAIDGTTIGAASASTGAFTTLSSSSTTTLNGTTIPASVTLVSTVATQTLTGKTISVDDNTVSGVAASSFVLSNGSGNIDGSAAQKAIPSGVVVGTSDTQTLTGKTISADDNTLSGIAASSFVLSNASGNIDGGAAQKVIPAGVVVGTSDTQTLTNKTLTSPVIANIVNTGTLTLPTSTDTLVGRATTDTLTNKTLTAPVIGTIVNTGTLTLPTATDTLVGRATTDTLTNKTISGANNTISNIGNGSLTNSSVTVGSTSIALGATSTTLAGLSSVTSTSFVGALTGNADTATTADALTTARNINGTSFDGSANITTASWGTSRTIGIGATGKSVDGSANVSWTVDEIGATAKTSTTGSSLIPAGTELQRDGSPAAGYFRFNTDVSKFEGYNGTSWGSVGGGATGGGADAVFVENDQTVTANYTIPATKNAMSTGPVTINSGVTVTISSGARYVVI
jgi:hypothetical protein